MQVITGDIDTVAGPALRELLRQRLRDIEPYKLSELGYFLVVEPGDSIETIDEQLGFSILGNRWDGTRWGDPVFTPSWEILEEHPGWYELVYVLSDDGCGVTTFVSKHPGVDPELLALRLAELAGIDTAQARIVLVKGSPVAVDRRFDRTDTQARIPYMSGATLLQAGRNDEHAYTEVIDQMRAKCADFTADARQVWRRLVFNHLITNVDDHLQNIGFLYVGNNQWRLSPAFDLNPFPDKGRESKTWLSEDTGPITSMEQLLGQAARFFA